MTPTILLDHVLHLTSLLYYKHILLKILFLIKITHEYNFKNQIIIPDLK